MNCSLRSTASDFSLRICISNASDATASLRSVDWPINRRDRLAVETMPSEADDAFACRTISAAGGTIETMVSNGLHGRQLVVTLPLAT